MKAPFRICTRSPVCHNLLDSFQKALFTAVWMTSSVSYATSSCPKEGWNYISSASEGRDSMLKACILGAHKTSSPLGWNIRDSMKCILFLVVEGNLATKFGSRSAGAGLLVFSASVWSGHLTSRWMDWDRDRSTKFGKLHKTRPNRCRPVQCSYEFFWKKTHSYQPRLQPFFSFIDSFIVFTAGTYFLKK